MARPRYPHLIAKAERLIDADVQVEINGQSWQLSAAPWYEPCLVAWLDAKSRRYAFGWPEFISFLRDMAMCAPEDLRFAKVVMRDVNAEFVAENVEWQVYDATWIEEAGGFV